MLLEVKHRTGELILDLNMFFPTNLVRYKKLLEVIDSSENKETYIKQLEKHFENRLVKIEKQGKEENQKYFDFKQMAADAETPYFKNYYETCAKKSYSETKKLFNQKKKFMKYQEILKQRK